MTEAEYYGCPERVYALWPKGSYDARHPIMPNTVVSFVDGEALPDMVDIKICITTHRGHAEYSPCPCGLFIWLHYR